MHHLDLGIGHLGQLNIALYALWLIEAKSYGVYHLDVVIGHLKRPDATHYALWLIESISYEVHHMNPVIAASHALWLIDTKSYGYGTQIAPSGPRYQPPGTPRRRALCVMTYRGEKLCSAPAGPRHQLPGTPRLWVESYGVHHLDLVIGHLEDLDAALYAL